VTELPRGIAKLEKMRYLLAGVNFKKLHEKMAESGMNNHNGRIPEEDAARFSMRTSLA
jgi:hypothetical protein